MSQLRYTKGQLYLRRYKQGDQADSIITAYQMAANGLLNAQHGKSHYYVAVRRGFPHEVLAAAKSKRELRRRFTGRSWQETRQWFRVAQKDRRQAEGDA